MLKDWLVGRRLYCVIGLGGVHPEESMRARKIGKLFTYGLVIVAIALLFEWQMQRIGYLYPLGWQVFNWLIWLFFAMEYVTLYTMIRNKRRFVRENWLLLIILILGVPFLINHTLSMEFIRPLRPLLSILLMVPALGFLLRFFVDGRLMTSIFGAIVIVVFFGVLVAGVDANVQTAWDGIWWALATVSTVGYGDVVPVSFLGRLIGGALVVLGLGIFVVITANFLGIILREEVKGVKRGEREVELILREMRALHDSQRQLQSQMSELQERLEKLGKDSMRD